MTIPRKIFKLLITHMPFIISGFIIAVLGSFYFRSLPVTPPNSLIAYYRYDSAALQLFLQNVKKNNGILVLGTSETASGPKGMRYWEIGPINGRPVYALYGAGRASYSWIPLFLHYREVFKEMSVIFYANPVYWSRKLNRFEENYYRRYFSLNFLNGINTDIFSPEIKQIHEKYASQYTHSLKATTLYPKQWGTDYMDVISSSINENYKFFLKRYLELPREHASTYEMVIGTPQEQILLQDYHLQFNLPKTAINRFPEGLSSISNDRFQSEALQDFITVAQYLQIDLTVLVGPYNKLLAQQKSVREIEPYDNVQQQMLSLLENAHVPSIDARDLNSRIGVFPDQMHLTKFIGHELIYHKIKDHYAHR